MQRRRKKMDVTRVSEDGLMEKDSNWRLSMLLFLSRFVVAVQGGEGGTVGEVERKKGRRVVVRGGERREDGRRESGWVEWVIFYF